MLGRARYQKSGRTDMSYSASGWLSGHRRVLVSGAAAGIVAALVLLPLAASSSAASRTANSAAIPAAAARQLSMTMERWAKLSGDAKPLWIAAVSYTHLRAHETRHDLVCRLL